MFLCDGYFRLGAHGEGVPKHLSHKIDCDSQPVTATELLGKVKGNNFKGGMLHGPHQFCVMLSGRTRKYLYE